MRTQDLSTSSEDNVGRSVVVSELVSSSLVNCRFNCLADKLISWRCQLSVQDVQDTLSDLFGIHYVEEFPINGYCASVVLLTTRCWIEG